MKIFQTNLRLFLVFGLCVVSIVSMAQQKPDAGNTGRVPGAPETAPSRIVDINPDDQRYNDSLLNAKKLPPIVAPTATATAALAEETAQKEALRRKIFGSSIFNNKNLKFDPDMNIATPVDYMIGPGDELIVNFYGAGQANFKQMVQPDGFIVFERVGLVNVSGLTIDEAKSKIKNKFAGLMPPNTQMNLSLGNIRTIRVTVIGEAINPGTYSVPSLSTVLNALYLAGGPNEIGSYRDIQLIRNNKVVATLDLYEFITKGLKGNDLRLADQDRILVNPYKQRIELTGEIKKPGIFEITDNETLAAAIGFSGGYTESAYTNRIKLIRNTEREHKIIDIKGDELGIFKIKNGDILTVGKILERYENQVNINGAVFRPGQYSLTENPSLLSLIKSAENVREDAYLNRIRIIRLKNDLTVSTLSVNLAKILNGEAPDIPLQREDRVEISSNFDLKEVFTVGIRGEVNLTGLLGQQQVENTEGNAITEADYIKAPYYNDMTVSDLIIQANGFKESAAGGSIDITRRKKKSGAMDDLAITSDLSQTYQIKISSNLALSENDAQFKLEPFDEVFVRASPNYETQQFITITGQVIKPGPYGLERKDERLSDVVKRSGGLSEFAFSEGATLVRTNKLTEIEQETKRKQQLAIADTKNATVTLDDIGTETQDRIGIDLDRAIRNPGSNYDIILQDGDVLNIPKRPQTVKLSGEVLYPNTTQFDESFGFRKYISRAGGFTSQSIKRKSYILYANGAVDRTKRIFLFNFYPKVRPGAEIIVPQKIKQTTLGEIFASFTGIAGTLSTLVSTYLLIKSLNPSK
jgi:protein involved in polysaccharide export with SLBB domain